MKHLKIPAGFVPIEYDGVAPGYFINREGQVWSSKSKKTLKSRLTGRGLYPRITLSAIPPGKQTSIYIHRLLATALLPNPKGHPIVRHLNDIGTDNRLENLAWGTHSQNGFDAVRNGHTPGLAGMDNKVAILRRWLAGEKQADLAAEYGVTQQGIGHYCRQAAAHLEAKGETFDFTKATARNGRAMSGVYDTDDKVIMFRRWEAGETQDSLAAEYGISPRGLRKYFDTAREHLGITKPVRKKPGQVTGMGNKVTILRRWLAGEAQRALGAEYGVSKAAIQKYIRAAIAHLESQGEVVDTSEASTRRF